MEIEGLLVDLDGTLYVGDEPVEGAGEALDRLGAAGMEIRSVTNTTRKSRSAVHAGLRASANRRVAYVSNCGAKAIQSSWRLPSTESCQPIGGSSKIAALEDIF